MPSRSLERQRLAGLFLAGAALWFSPLLLRAEHAGRLFGVPALYVYIFVSWALLIGLAALVLARGRE